MIRCNGIQSSVLFVFVSKYKRPSSSDLSERSDHSSNRDEQAIPNTKF